MDVKITVLLVLVTFVSLLHFVLADFFYNRKSPRDMDSSKLKCVPGRTVMKIEEKVVEELRVETDSEEFMRSGHSAADAEERCSICVCSASGTDEFCYKRSTSSVNECMVINKLMNDREALGPFDLQKSLAHRIRRGNILIAAVESEIDLIWHNDEIPYERTQKCFRGHSYYTNHDTPNDTDLNFEDEGTSLLDYQSNSTCYYCVCSVSGDGAGCISRSLWFCNYLRYFRSGKTTARDMYANLFQQDRPTYFRQLSWRMRRTMDDSLFSLIEHVSGGVSKSESRRQLDSTKRCVPYVSEYSDCNEFNACDGCTKCMCSTDAIWECRSVKICNEHDEEAIDDEMFDAAINKLEFDMKKLKKNQQKYAPELNFLLSEALENKSAKSESNEQKLEEELRPIPVNNKLVPDPPGPKRQETEDLLEQKKYLYPEESIKKFLGRQKRSASKKNADNKHNKRSTEKASNKRQTRNSIKSNDTIKFYSTVDELNEDILKNSNHSGTLTAKKMELAVLPNLSRRSNNLDKSNKSLHIDFNNHITDNKIDTVDHDIKFDVSHEKLNVILGNYTQKAKDKELSKLVVNELRPGSEIVGDSKAPVTSNITFTLENDTLTAMAYIAGNLLNKLWTMEKDTRGSALETEDMKHEKISDLLDLFKEPLNLKQEKFLKNVLERLSNAMDTDKEIKNGTLCQTIEEATNLIHDYDNPKEEDTIEDTKKIPKPKVKQNLTAPCTKTDKSDINNINQYAAAKAISKINTVLGLLRNLENIHANLTNIKNRTQSPLRQLEPVSKKLIIDTVLTKNEANSLNMYGNLLDKVTKLLLPKQNKEKITNLIKQENILNDDLNFRRNFKEMFKTDLGNMTVTDKDKIILDYLTHISSKPDCMLNKLKQNENIQSLPTIEGNILLNLSEFFKIKSLADLINLVEPKKATTKTIIPTSTVATSKADENTPRIEKTTSKNLRIDSPNKFASTKEKLKAHLKTIIEDLIELQDAKGIHTRGNIKIADALPCIYNIMNAGKEFINKNSEEKTKDENLVDIFNELRIDMRRMQTRRSGPIMAVRSKSAVVLERVIKNLSEKSKLKTRRVLQEKNLKSYKKIKDNLSKMSSDYKRQSLYIEVPAAERLVVLKTIQREVKSYITALEGIKREYHNMSKMSADQISELASFIFTSATNITLDEKVMDKIQNSLYRKYHVNQIGTVIEATTVPVEPLDRINAQDFDNDIKISRNQIVNHLIRKRVEMYIKLKEAKEYDVEMNMNYNIAKRVLYYLNNGNFNLAQELFKMLAIQKFDVPETVSTLKPVNKPAYQNILPRPQLSAPVEEPKILENETKYMSQDHLIRQLLNIKNMGI